MTEMKIEKIGDFIEQKDISAFDLTSTLRLKAKSIDRKKLWASKDRSAEFMGEIWSLFVDTQKEEKIKTILHSVCVELIENSVKFGKNDFDYIITVDLCLNTDTLFVYVLNNCEPSQISDLRVSANMILDTDDVRSLFKEKMVEAKLAKKEGKTKSQLGFIRIAMQGVELAWQIKTEHENIVVTTLAKISLNTKDE